jgi:septal ring-binding cell division protein DamX
VSLQTPPAPAEPATRACPRCGAPLTPDQEWCLNCGADVGARVATTPRWKVPVILVGLLLAAALGAVALALVELADDHQQQVAQTPTVTATATPAPSPPPGEQPAPGEAGATSTPVPQASDGQTGSGQSGSGSAPENEGQGNTNSGTGQTGSGNTNSGTGQTGTGTGTGTATIAEWPAGKTAWTVVLESATSESAAQQKAQELSSGGTSVGVLRSDDFSSLNKGYWVVFSGQYETQSAAQSALSSLTAKVPQAYVRHVVPR